MIWEVFRQDRKGQPFEHAGSVEAPDAEFAEAWSREQYGRRGESVALCLIPRTAVHVVGDLVEPTSRDRATPVEQVQLDQRRAAVLLRLAVERERVRVVGQQLVHRARMTDLVLCDRGERDVLFEHRRDSRPLGVAPPDDQLVVSQAQQKLVHAPPSGVP